MSDYSYRHDLYKEMFQESIMAISRTGRICNIAMLFENGIVFCPRQDHVSLAVSSADDDSFRFTPPC